ncbi:MAG UNVERIFIED_CONTAM: aspartate-semialdehyde dehydrogenase [Planctomycetaceae bacterium]
MFETVAVVGATGAVGRIILQLLEQRSFPAKRFRFFASARSAGQQVAFAGGHVTIEELTHDCFGGIDLVIASTPDETAAEFLPSAVKAGCRVIDESGYWRMHPDVALVIPEIDPEAALNARGIIASPNCSTTQMAARTQAAPRCSSGASSGCRYLSGCQRRRACRAQLICLAALSSALAGEPYSYAAFRYPIAFNAIPQIGSFKQDGYTSEELKMIYETRKILGDESIQVCPTCIRIPVANCHSETINVETERPLSVDEARALFAATPGITVLDDPASFQYPMPQDCSGSDAVFVGRIRRDLSHPNCLTFWCVSDNLRKGAATNAVQIAELLAQHASN